MVAFAAMDDDPEAQALRDRFAGMKETRRCLDEPCDGQVSGRVAGNVGYAAGARAGETAADQALSFPDEGKEEQYVYYGPWFPDRGHLKLDFRFDAFPGDHGFMTLLSVGTGGNTCMTLRVYPDGVVTAGGLTKREWVKVSSDPVAPGQWHHMDYWYGPEGALLLVDGTIQDFSTDYATPYATNLYQALYLGDQPWWSAPDRKAVFYRDDSFVGLVDNLALSALEPGGNP